MSDFQFFPTVANPELGDLTQVPVELYIYTVSIRNTTVETFDEVVLFYKRLGLEGVVFLGTTGFKPGDRIIFPLGMCGGMVSYAVGLFKGGTLLATIPNPQDGAAMTPDLAANLDPARPDACTDAWAVVAGSVLDLSQYLYTVVIRNNSEHVWDSVVLFYEQKGLGTQGLETSAVDPQGVARLELCPCNQMEGYAFSIFDEDGQRVVLSPNAPTPEGQLRFPGTGLMYARRAWDFKLTPDLDACGDLWELELVR